MPTDLPLLRFLTCGAVDDGKSTLIGRLLADTGQVEQDRLLRLERLDKDSEALDYSRLVDGLEAEQEQGITIDVCHRRFATLQRQFVVIDSPGHTQYTRNMASAASQADAALLLVDARAGIIEQTRRHLAICVMMGVRDVALVVNKMDLVEDHQQRFATLSAEFRALAQGLKLQPPACFATIATLGLGVTTPFVGDGLMLEQSLLEWLETLNCDGDSAATALRLPVSMVQQTSGGGRWVMGTLASGGVAVGEALVVSPSKAETVVREMLVSGEPCQRASNGQAVALLLEPEVDTGRGAVLTSTGQPPTVTDQFAATLIWFGEAPAFPGRAYHLRIGTQWVQASITSVRHVLDPTTQSQLAGHTLNMNMIGTVHVATTAPIVCDRFDDNRALGSFILVDRLTSETVAGGVIRHPLRRSNNIHPERSTVTPEDRAMKLGQKPLVAWLTGLSGSGKSTIAKATEQRLATAGLATFLLDGDNLRHGLNRDLGFTEADRVENIRRAGEVAKLMTDAGIILIASFIAPFEQDRAMIRQMIGEDLFVEVFIDAPLSVCEGRDPKGLYAKARSGLLPNMTGIDSPYQAPQNPDLRLDTANLTVEHLADELATLLIAKAQR